MTVLLTTLILLVAAVHGLPFRGENLVDLSYVYDETTIGWVDDQPYRMTVTANGTTPQGNWVQSEEILSGTHVGTHMDAPCHMARGRWMLEDIPLSRMVAPAAVVDISDRAALNRDAVLEVSDLVQWERRTGFSLHGTVVLMRSGWGARWPDREAYLGTAQRDASRLRFPGVSPEAAEWLANNRRIYGLGVDTLSLDNGINTSRGAPAHQSLLGANIYGLENVANLHRLPEAGAQVHILPMKLGAGACGSPTRILAALP